MSSGFVAGVVTSPPLSLFACAVTVYSIQLPAEPASRRSLLLPSSPPTTPQLLLPHCLLSVLPFQTLFASTFLSDRSFVCPRKTTLSNSVCTQPNRTVLPFYIKRTIEPCLTFTCSCRRACSQKRTRGSILPASHPPMLGMG